MWWGTLPRPCSLFLSVYGNDNTVISIHPQAETLFCPTPQDGHYYLEIKAIKYIANDVEVEQKLVEMGA